MKIILESDQLAKTFNFFDHDCDGYISFKEFLIIFSDGTGQIQSATGSMETQENLDKQERENMSVMAKPRRSHEKYAETLEERGFGALTLPSDDMAHIIRYQF